MKALTTMIMPAANDDTTYCTRRAETILTLNSCDPNFQNNDLGQFILYSGTAVIRYLRPEFKFPAKIEMAFSQMLAIRSSSNELQ